MQSATYSGGGDAKNVSKSSLDLKTQNPPQIAK
jgi:hypothetical protein